MEGLNNNRKHMIRAHLAKVKVNLITCRLYMEDAEDYLEDLASISLTRIPRSIECLEMSLKEVKKVKGIFEKIKKIK